MKAFMEFLNQCVSPYHTVLAAEQKLQEAGFQMLRPADTWNLQYGGKYYLKHRDSSLMAFAIGTDIQREIPVRIAAAHTDFPCFSIKADPDLKKSNCLQVNVEGYGGMILSSWMDRPLSVAGRVALKSEHALKPEIRFVDFKRPIATIPNLAIHMNREMNKGVELNKQVDMLPVIGLQEELNEDGAFMKALAGELHTSMDQILDFDLVLYCTEAPCQIGLKEEMISASHLDDTSSVYALLQAMTQQETKQGINVIALFDHEEIGSRTAAGAGSIHMRTMLEKLLAALPTPVASDVLYESMLLSVDVAHAAHPNHLEKADLNLRPKMNAGFCIKEAAAQSYATDSSAIAVLQQICDASKIPYQKYANRSDIAGGGTLANIAAAYLPMAVVDIGAPILAMHSIRELMGCRDVKTLADGVTAFFYI